MLCHSRVGVFGQSLLRPSRTLMFFFCLSLKPSPWIAISATMVIDDLDLLLNLPNIEHLNPSLKILWMKMCRRTNFFDLNVSGSPTMSVCNCFSHDYTLNHQCKTSIYSNSKNSRGSIGCTGTVCNLKMLCWGWSNGFYWWMWLDAKKSTLCICSTAYCLIAKNHLFQGYSFWQQPLLQIAEWVAMNVLLCIKLDYPWEGVIVMVDWRQGRISLKHTFCTACSYPCMCRYWEIHMILNIVFIFINWWRFFPSWW